jgi:hypothetical protein
MDEALAVFRAAYGRLDAELQRHLSVVLQTIEATPSQAFSKLTPGAAYGELARWLQGRTPRERAFERKAAALAEGHPTTPAGVIPFLEKESARINAEADRLAAEHGLHILELDPETGLARYQPPLGPPADPWPDESHIPEYHRHYLAATALQVAEFPFLPGAERPE